jgi:pre-mRNA-splicing helicase BRR2
VALLDYDKFDLIKLLVTNRAKIYYCSRLKQAQSESERQAVREEMAVDLEGGGAAVLRALGESSDDSGSSGGGDGGAGRFASRLKEGARQFQTAGSTSNGADAHVGEESLLSLAASDNASQIKGRAERNLDLEDLQFSQGTRLMSNKVCELPAKSWRAQKKGYEEVHVPAVKAVVRILCYVLPSFLFLSVMSLSLIHLLLPACLHSLTLHVTSLTIIPLTLNQSINQSSINTNTHILLIATLQIPPDERLVNVDELPEWAAPAFPGIKALNRIQSRMVDAALHSSENLLLCAPTGAGKTNVALMCILNQLALYRNEEDGTFRLNAFKIVYVAPMKALVQENVLSLGKKLAPFGVKVAELSGDQNLTKAQIEETQVIVTTPEKWDIVTRKAGDRTYTQLVRLIIIDEIHLLHDERGSVLEALVARTLRQVEHTQEMVRLVGLSATLPNYRDVATFLRVKPDKGLFFFDSTFRPVPLQQQYIGVSEKKALKRFQLMNQICYEKVLQQAGRNQVLIFTHSRAETVKTAKALRDLAVENDTQNQFVKDNSASREILREEAGDAKSPDLQDLLPYGFAVHHAGLVRSDRTLVEDLFSDKHVQVLVSTATLAWGVNLPCHTVIIKGTQMYSPEKGRWVELSPMDVLQMLGRAGRYGLDKEGEGIIMTQHSELQFYLSLMNQQLPIESQLVKRLPDMMNAEIVLGTVVSVKEAALWLGYTYLYVRMLKNPVLYGVSVEELERDSTLMQRRIDLAHSAALVLDKSGLIRYDRRSGVFQTTNLGRVASHYYVSCDSVKVFNDGLKPQMTDVDVFRLFSLSGEFKNVHVRDEEKLELSKIVGRVPIPIKEGIDDPAAKINALLQTFVSRLRLDGFALVSDMVYVQQSAGRLMRALFEIAVKRGWAALAHRLLTVSKMVERRMWLSQSPLRQFAAVPEVLLRKLEKNSDVPWERYHDLKAVDLGELVKLPKMGQALYKYVHMFPRVELSAQALPLTRGLLRLNITATPDFQFDAAVHKGALSFHVMVVDGDGERILHHEMLFVQPQHGQKEHELVVVVPILEPTPPQYFIWAVSDSWLHAETVLPVSFRHLVLPKKALPPSELLDLQPMPVAQVGHTDLARLLGSSFDHLNAVQTQTYKALATTDDSVLLCAPTGSGKTVCAALALARLVQTKGDAAKCAYLCPKPEIAQAAHRYLEQQLGPALGLSVVLLSGELASDIKLLGANIIVATAAHWDMVSRRWKQRKNVQAVDLYIADELHLLGAREGPVMEVVLSRARFIASQLERPNRIVGLSAPISNAKDVGDWLGAGSKTVFNFPADVRPTPLDISLFGFDNNYAAARLLSMSKYAYNACTKIAPEKPCVVFLPSRKQTQLSAIDFITFASSAAQPDRFQRSGLSSVLEEAASRVQEAALAQTLPRGVGYLHHELSASDRRVVERLYEKGALAVLLCPYSYCWQLPGPCYASVIMDTVYYEGREMRFVDYSMADMLQMAGCACRPQQDERGQCIILCHTPKKELLKRLLYGSLPVESHLDAAFHDHLCAEVVTGTVESKQDAVDYLTWSFYYRRLSQNPNYYSLEGANVELLSDHLSELVEGTISDLEESKCIEVENDMDVSALNLGMISSYYYISYATVDLFAASVTAKTRIKGAMEIMSAASEFGQLTLRQGEREALERMARHLPQALPATADYDDPATKALVLLQTYFSRGNMATDLTGDLKLVLKDALKLLQALVDVISSQGWLRPALACMELSQMVVQGMWDKDPAMLQVPHTSRDTLARLAACNPPVTSVFGILEMEDEDREAALQVTEAQMSDVATFCNAYPSIDLTFELTDAEGATAVSGEAVGVTVTLQRDIDEEEMASLGKVVSARYPHAKQEAWWLMVGDTNTNSMLTIKRITVGAASRVKLSFDAPELPGDYKLTLYLCSDSYVGCDQEYDLPLTVVTAD